MKTITWVFTFIPDGVFVMIRTKTRNPKTRILENYYFMFIERLLWPLLTKFVIVSYLVGKIIFRKKSKPFTVMGIFDSGLILSIVIVLYKETKNNNWKKKKCFIYRVVCRCIAIGIINFSFERYRFIYWCSK